MAKLIFSLLPVPLLPEASLRQINGPKTGGGERRGEGRNNNAGDVGLRQPPGDQRHHSPSPSAGCVSTGAFIGLGKDVTGSLDGGSSPTLRTTGSVFVRPFNRFSQVSVGNLVF